MNYYLISKKTQRVTSEIFVLVFKGNIEQATMFNYSIFNCDYSRIVIIEIDNQFELEKLRRRYMNSDDYIEVLKEELDEGYSDDSLFNITSWGADLSFREICAMYDEDELVKPELQRKYVWDKLTASRFIESILMGLPVPSIFLAQCGSQKLIVDGYQRIMTVHDYINGVFSGDGKVFKLSNSDKINKRWRNKAFKELSSDDQRKIRSTTIHAIVFEQKTPKDDDTSMYQIFERINTSGRTLTPQEIRNCVYQGTLNSLLFDLNKHNSWRILFGTDVEDSRMRDLEFILRFFFMTSTNFKDLDLSQINLKKSLNDFMSVNQNANEDVIERYRERFQKVMDSILKTLGEDAFHNYSNDRFTKKFHPAIFDAVAVAYFNKLELDFSIDNVNVDTHIKLFKNEKFIEVISNRTTDVANIISRIDIVTSTLFGEI